MRYSVSRNCQRSPSPSVILVQVRLLRAGEAVGRACPGCCRRRSDRSRPRPPARFRRRACLLRQRHGQQRVAYRAALAQRPAAAAGALQVAGREVDALGDGAVDLLRVEALDLRRSDRRAEDAEHRPGVEAARHHRRDEVGGHALHDLVARDDAGDVLLAGRAVDLRRDQRPRGRMLQPGWVSMRKVSHLPPAKIISALTKAAPPLVSFAPSHQHGGDPAAACLLLLHQAQRLLPRRHTLRPTGRS